MHESSGYKSGRNQAFSSSQTTMIADGKAESSLQYKKTDREKQILPPRFLETIAQKIQDFEIYDDDVWVVTVPKSGTFWMQETLCCLLHGMDLEKLKLPDYKRSYNIEIGGTKVFAKMDVLQIDNVSKFSATLERPRVMKTHLFWNRLPEALRDPNSKAKIIYVARNPKDVCISRFYYSQMFKEAMYQERTKSLDTFVNEFLGGRMTFLPYWDHVLEFWGRKDSSKILFVKFEEMKTDFSKVLDKLQVFLGLNPLTEEQKRRVTDYLSFEKMKRNKTLANFMHFDGQLRQTYVNSGEEANFMRKGKTGGWKEEMSPELIQRFDEWILKHTAGTDYSVDVE